MFNHARRAVIVIFCPPGLFVGFPTLGRQTAPRQVFSSMLAHVAAGRATTTLVFSIYWFCCVRSYFFTTYVTHEQACCSTTSCWVAATPSSRIYRMFISNRSSVTIVMQSADCAPSGSSASMLAQVAAG